MSSEARDEAVRIVAQELNGFIWAPPLDACVETATVIVDRLLETHAISRRAPRSYRLGTKPPRPLPGQRPDGRTRL